MIFMNNETGVLYEMLIMSLSDEMFKEQDSIDALFRIAEIALYNPKECGSIEMLMSDFYKHFTFIGFI